jgi:hypothetical protein
MNHSFAMSQPVLKIAQIYILIRNVLKAKPIFLPLSGQIGLPTPQIKGAIEIPNDILIRGQLIVHPIFEFPHNHLLLHLLQVHPKQIVEAYR